MVNKIKQVVLNIFVMGVLVLPAFMAPNEVKADVKRSSDLTRIQFNSSDSVEESSLKVDDQKDRHHYEEPRREYPAPDVVAQY